MHLEKGHHLVVPMPYFQRQLLGIDSSNRPITSPSPYLSGNPALASIAQISGTATGANQQYHSLQATLRKRMSKGLEFQTSYTFSKGMSDAIGYYGEGGQSASQSAYWQNLYDQRAEWGPTYFDARHMFTLSHVWDIPVGRGRAFGGSMNRVLNQFIALHTNKRTDRWGGSYKNRIRLPIEVVRRCRDAVGPDFIIIYRLSMIDLVPDGSTTEEVIAAFRHYVLEEAKKYEPEFPNELYMQWYRLYNIPVPERGKSWHFKYLTVNHIYHPLAKSSGKILMLLRALKARGGDRQKKLFQFLNDMLYHLFSIRNAYRGSTINPWCKS